MSFNLADAQSWALSLVGTFMNYWKQFPSHLPADKRLLFLEVYPTAACQDHRIPEGVLTSVALSMGAAQPPFLAQE